MNDLSNKDLNYEEERHRCEVRQLLAWRKEWGLQRFQGYIQNPRFDSRRPELYRDFAEQWKRGNRGEKGDWR